MREIKFMVFDKRLGKIFPVIRLCEDFEGDCEEPYCYYLNNRNELEWLPLSEGILMQYTGLKDKNGKKIYEDYIVKHKQYVAYGTLSEHVGKITISPYDGVMVGHDSIGKYVEVIGNIYENPELLD